MLAGRPNPPVSPTDVSNRAHPSITYPRCNPSKHGLHCQHCSLCDALEHRWQQLRALSAYTTQKTPRSFRALLAELNALAQLQAVHRAHCSVCRQTIQPCGCQLFPPPKRSPREEALHKIKIEAVRLGQNGTREGFKFAETLFERIPELKGA